MKERMGVWVTVSLMGFGVSVGAQNLVPNGSFEEYTTCPDYFGQWAHVVDWTSPYTSSADYFNSCAGGDVCNVPLNQFGHQLAYEGSAYMGIATCDGSGSPMYREIIAAELNEPLQVGVPVCVSFRTTCGGYGSSVANSAAFQGRGPGAQFFVELPDDWSTYLYPNDAAVFMDTVLADTAAWVLVSGTYVPDSAYRFIAIGNFFADSLSWVTPLLGSGGLPGAYAFVDDIRVSTDLSYCTLSTSMPDPIDQLIHVPSVFGSELLLRSELPFVDDKSVEVYNAWGCVVARERWPSGRQELVIGTVGLSAGFYVVIISGSRGAASSFHLVHITP